MTAPQFVDTLNATVGNPLSSGERNQLVTERVLGKTGTQHVGGALSALHTSSAIRVHFPVELLALALGYALDCFFRGDNFSDIIVRTFQTYKNFSCSARD